MPIAFLIHGPETTCHCGRMRQFFHGRFAALMFGLASSALPATAPSLAAQVVAITHVTVVHPTGPPAGDMTVIIRDGIITSIASSSRTTLPRDATAINARGQYLIAGLFDMHVHTLLEGGAWALGEYVSHGITTVRDMGGRFETIDSLRREVRSGRLVGPRVFAVGPQIEHAASMQYILTKGSSDVRESAPWDRLELLTPAAATRAVDSLVRLGVDFIKGRNFEDAATYWSVAAAARRAGRLFVGHPPVGIDAIALADSGQRTVEHWYYPDNLPKLAPAEYDRIIAKYRTNGIAFVPTLSTWNDHRFVIDSMNAQLASALNDPRAARLPGSLRRNWQSLLDPRLTEEGGKPATAEQLTGWNRALDGLGHEIGRLSAAGVLVLAGSDMPFALYPGDALHRELVNLVRSAGLTPQQALAAATIQPARSLGLQDSLGSIAVGKIADLVLLNANPLADITNVRHVNRVMRGGRWIWARRAPRSPLFRHVPPR